MPNPTDFLEQQADLLFENLSGWETRVLERIAKRIKNTGKMNLADVKSLNNITVTNQEMAAIIKDLVQVTGQNIEQIQKIYGDVISQQHDNNKYLYDYRNKPFVAFSDNTQLQAMVKAYSKSTGETMINLSKTKSLGFINEFGRFKNMQDSIYDTFGKAVMQVATGSGDFTTAMRGAIEQLGSSGIRVHYGSSVNRRLDTVIRQNVLWGAKQASIEYNDMIGEELDCDGIEIDFHSNPRPSHEFMQGMQYSLNGKRTVNGVTYESADRALERLNDYGCLHFKTPIILGISEPRYSDEELAEMRRKNAETKTVDGVEKSGYDWTQDMRRLETEARKEKEIINSLKVAGDEEGARQHRKKLRAINEKYKAITDQTGLTPQKERMRVYGGTKTVTNSAKTIANVNKSGIIKEKTISKEIVFSKPKPKPILSQSETIEKAKEMASDTAYNSANTMQEIRAITNKKLGYDGLPQVVSSEEFEALSKDRTVFYRGIHESESKSATEIVEEFKSGPLWTGNSGQAVFGNGVYFTETKSLAKGEYAGNGGAVIEALLNKDAKVADFETIYKEFFETGIPKIIGMPKEDYQYIIRDVGQYAAVKGYDAIALNGYQNHDYLVLLNRTKCIIRG